jgi:hypothetical protein
VHYTASTYREYNNVFLVGADFTPFYVNGNGLTRIAYDRLFRLSRYPASVTTLEWWGTRSASARSRSEYLYFRLSAAARLHVIVADSHWRTVINAEQAAGVATLRLAPARLGARLSAGIFLQASFCRHL